MKINQVIANGVLVLMLDGRLDAKVAPLLQERLVKISRQGDTKIVVDLSGVDFMDSSGLGVLVSSGRQFRQLHGDIKLACLGHTVHRVFDLTRTLGLFDIYDDPMEAALSFHHG
jgi:anti-sigma B factor antagonist